MPSLADIPLIDLQHCNTTESLACAVHKAAASLGFLYLKNTGLEQLAEQMFEISSDFFHHQSAEDRLKCAITTQNRGYVKIGQESLDPSKPNDAKEVFMIGLFTPQGDPIQYLPSQLQAHIPEIGAFQKSCHNLCQKLLEAFAVALHLPKDFFSKEHLYTTGNPSALRLLRYPATTASGKIINRADGSVTLLFCRGRGGQGLQVLPPTSNPDDEESWQDVPVVKDAVLVNIGDALEFVSTPLLPRQATDQSAFHRFWTGAFYRSTLHRVLGSASGAEERYSIAWFNQPLPHAVLKPVIPTTEVTASDIIRAERKGVKLSQQITSMEHLQKRLAATYTGRSEA